MTPEQARFLGIFIRDHRVAHNMSARGLASAARVDVTTITRIESGQFMKPSTDKLRRIATALDIPVHDLLQLADYLTAAELPPPKPYLRTKFPDLPPEAVDQAERYLTELMREHGVVPNGPAPGEDETLLNDH
jgi:transcriptional regulator with XRE-family HTH domain